MTVYLGRLGGNEGLYLIDPTARRILAVIEKPAYWSSTYQTLWIDEPGFWHSGELESVFPRESDAQLMEFKDKHYVQLGLTPDGYRKWRGIDKLEDSHDTAWAQISGEQNGD